ncbi:phospholipid carrier-dependent glycosyltransferase [Paenibacillus sp. H1-7]|nr:phospholipid carrier-dependent glycosyltransferase [Paenibacillus sp. H1-7]
MLFTIWFAWMYRYMKQSAAMGVHQDEIKNGWLQARYLYPAILCTGLAVRLAIAYGVYGYDVDVNTFKAWADHAASAGITRFYTSDLFVDYPPGYIYVLYAVGWLRSALQLAYDSPLFLLLLKSPAIAADLLTSYLLFRLGSRYTAVPIALGASLIYLFNPAVIVDSAAWGQADSFFMLWMLLCFEAIVSGKLRRASVFYAIALLIKPQALLFGFILLVLFIRRGSWRTLLQCLGCGLAVFAALAAPFLVHKEPLWLVSLYFGTLSSYPYASLNAFNVMSLFGGNFVSITDPMVFFTYQTWSMILMALVLLYAAFLYFKSSKDETQLLVIATLLIAGAFMVIAKMHERYLFYALPLLAQAFLHSRDRRLLLLLYGFSVTTFINVNEVLRSSFQGVYHLPSDDSLVRAVSFVNVLLFIALSIVAWKLIIRGETKELVPTEKEAGRESGAGRNKPQQKEAMGQFKAIGAAIGQTIGASGQISSAKQDTASLRFGLQWLLPRWHPLNWSRKDTLLLGALIIVYTVLAFYQLGSTQAPQTAWQATQSGERIVFRLGQTVAIDRINSFSGIGDGSFTYEISEDGQTWSAPISVASDTFKAFMWQPTPVSMTGRYVRLTVDKPPFALYEVSVYASDKETPVPIESVQGDRVDPSTVGDLTNLTDESETSAYSATFMNGTYFDEIYHARTAFEHLHKLEPYEWTHPPLGKLLISVGIMVFGMNPFGWRIVGTLFGIAMIPIMYLFGKRMFGRSEYGFAAAFLMTVDGLHFVQTRIATIDVYGVFFILLMFYFMYRCCTMNLFDNGWRKFLVPFGLCGLCFGLGAASKWIVLYAGCGLAALFFLWLLLHYAEYRRAVRGLKNSGYQADVGLLEHWQHIRAVFPHRAIVTLAWACVFYLLVPATIYVLSYAPFMMVPGPGHGFKEVLLYQKYMLDYHSQLQGTHPFSSTWWQWPVMSKPVWYYGAADLAPDTISSIAAIGNPLVWWVGFAAVILLLASSVFRYRNAAAVFLLIAFFSQYIPWMFVPRMTFIYHYFAMVPFSILAIVYFWQKIQDRLPGAAKWGYAYLAAAAVCFAMFYPVLSGITVSRTYAEHMLKWLPQWIFF